MFVIIRHSLKIKKASFHYRSRLSVCGSVNTSCGAVTNFSAYQDKIIINMSKDYVNKIPVFTRKNVHIKDKVKLNVLLNKIIDGGVDNLQVVFDFDRTLTKQHEDGKQFFSSFGLFRHCSSITKEYVESENRLTSTYYPIEISPSISMEEKKKKMEEWWSESMKLFKGLKVPRDEIDEVVAKYSPSLRDGTKELFADLNKNTIPVLIFSAGVGDVIMSVLKHYEVNYPVVKVVSNFLNYSGTEDEILGFKEKPIDVFSKNEYALKGTDYYKLIENRENVILLGDSIGDAGMADGMPHCNAVLKIGFLYDHINENLPKYMDTFDIVLEDDQTMDVIRAILKYLF